MIEERGVRSAYTYVIVRTARSGQRESRSGWRVIKSIVHPNYTTSWRKTHRFESNLDPETIEVIAGLNQVNNDVALLKVEEDNDIFDETNLNRSESEGDNDAGNFFDDITRSEGSGNESRDASTTQEEPQDYICIEILENRRNPNRTSSSKGAFQFPSEQRRFYRRLPDDNTPLKAQCVLVGHSPVFSR